MKQTPITTGYYFPVCFSNHKPVFIASEDNFWKWYPKISRDILRLNWKLILTQFENDENIYIF